MPVSVELTDTASSVVAGANYGMELTSVNKVWTWGYNKDGQLGLGTTTNEDVRSGPTLKGATSIAAGGAVSLGVLSDGSLDAWGSNVHGQLGDGSTTGPQTCSGNPCSVTPESVPGLSAVTGVAAGASTSYATTGGQLYAFGANGNGQFGNGTTTGSDVPTAVGAGYSEVAMAPGSLSLLGVMPAGSVYAAGGMT